MRLNQIYQGICATAVLLLPGCAASPGGGGPVPQPAEAATPSEHLGTGTTVLYAPVALARYRLEMRDSVAMEMPDGSFQRTVTVKTAHLTASFRDSAGLLATSITLDSLALDQPNSLMQGLVDSTRGTRWDGMIREHRRIDSLRSSRPSIFGEQIRTMLYRLFPVLPEDGAAPGRSWADSASMPFQLMAGFDASEQRVAAFRATKIEDREGTRSLTIQSTTTYAVSGSGSTYGQTISIEGTGRATGTHRVSLGGRLLAAQVTDTVRMTLAVSAVGQSVPAVVVGSYTLTQQP